MALLGGIGDQTVAEAQKDVQSDIGQLVTALAPVLKLATAIQTLIDDGVVISIQKNIKLVKDARVS